jgi:pilus assembly protein Flp/PilA
MRVRRDERGATLVEYSLLLMFIALVAITGVTALGLEIASLFEGIDLPG